jgi:hypothetical protein
MILFSAFFDVAHHLHASLQQPTAQRPRGGCPSEQMHLRKTLVLLVTICAKRYFILIHRCTQGGGG